MYKHIHHPKDAYLKKVTFTETKRAILAILNQTQSLDLDVNPFAYMVLHACLFIGCYWLIIFGNIINLCEYIHMGNANTQTRTHTHAEINSKTNHGPQSLA